MKKNISFLLLLLCFGFSASVFSQSANALNFAGVDDIVRINSNVSINAVTPRRTIQLNFKPANLTTANRQMLWEEGGETNGFNAYIVNGELYVGAYTGTNVNLPPTRTKWLKTTVIGTGWHQLNFIFDGSLATPIMAYLDGVPIVTLASETGVGLFNAVAQHTDPNAIGGINNNTVVADGPTTFTRLFGSAGFFEGTIDEVKIWKRALTLAEASSMQCQLSLPQNDLIGYYTFNHGIAGGNNAGVTTLTDFSGLGNNGSLSGFALSGTSSNWVHGYFSAPAITCPGNISQNNDPGQCYATVTFPKTNILQYNPTGYRPSDIPIEPTNIAAYVTASGLSQVGQPFVTYNDDVWPVGNNFNTLTPNLDHYLTFTTTFSSATELTNLTYHKFSYLGNGPTKAVLRTSLDAFSTNIAMVDVDPAGLQILDFDLSSLPLLNGTVTFRIYFYGAASAGDWADLVSTARAGGTGLRLFAEQIAQASSSCGITSVTYSGMSPNNQYPVGTTTITATATDAGGNTASCSFDIVVTDNQAPVITCPVPNASYNTDAGECNATLSFAATATDNCIVSSYAYSINGSPITFPYDFAVGTTTVTAVAEDVNGNTSAPCTFDVVVKDNENPGIVCPANIVVNPTSLDGAVVNYSITSGDNCPGSTTELVSGKASGSTFAIGTTTNTYTITDAAGNSVTCSFTITVQSPYCNDNGNNTKVYVCKNGNTICVSVNALEAHLNNGATLGACVASKTANPQPIITFAPISKASVFPNPSQGQINVQLPATRSGKMEIMVMRENGVVMERRMIQSASAGQIVRFDLRKGGAGIYFIKIVSAEGVENLKVTVL